MKVKKLFKHADINCYDFEWFVSPPKEQEKHPIHVVVGNKKFRVYWNLFNHGYRCLGLGFPNKHNKSFVVFFGIGEIAVRVK